MTGMHLTPFRSCLCAAALLAGGTSRSGGLLRVDGRFGLNHDCTLGSVVVWGALMSIVVSSVVLQGAPHALALCERREKADPGALYAQARRDGVADLTAARLRYFNKSTG